ncbi:sigma-70 family RNA polymerase sigma factor [Sphingopyxis sp. YF1]|jgi:RNA polymerase sigma-70 factor (ECF subfamily)|uniref:RNA polymerase sigma factor n=1 Tax=Sphingopyxis sp. YF1 TaxID=2482763 RepID=UPI001F61CA87|nr:sigma-70 family RNA polymerase sigma factor [Sphingopyxis sp. YF1]UNU42776.1 sigma-70 family RNA polymerase sigma factor [Sphingopyxis sp. YF1]
MRSSRQDDLFVEAMARFGPALVRLARGYEADADLRRDLEQELQVALWQSFGAFDGRCSLGTWVWRVAHNRATSHVLQQQRRNRHGWSSIEDLDLADDAPSPLDRATNEQAMALVLSIVGRLDPPDRQILLLYLEGVTGTETAEITGVSADAVATKIHRFKTMLARRFAGQGDVR